MRGFSFSLFFFCLFVCLFVFLWIKCKFHGEKHENGGSQYNENGKYCDNTEAVVYLKKLMSKSPVVTEKLIP